MQATHRSGPLKQKNKQHQTLGHKSNRQLKQKSGGKVGVKQIIGKKNKLVEWRNDRKNREKDLKKQKRLNVFNLKRSLGQLHNAPYIISILYFGSDLNGDKNKEILNLLTKFEDEGETIHHTSTGNIILTSSRLKLRFQFLLPNMNNLYECMDAAKLTDVLLCVYDANEENKIEELKSSPESILNAIYHHCLPTCFHIINGLNGIPIKKQNNLKKLFQKQLDSLFPDEKLHFLDNKQDALQLLNLIGNCKKKSIVYRERRSELLADKLEYDEGNSLLKVYGYVRNKNLDVNKLIHIPGLNDFKINKIQVIDDPYRTNNMNDNQNTRIYLNDPVNGQSLWEELVSDDDEDFDNDQELPTAEDIAKAEQEYLKQKKLVPKGTSDYQATWLIDSEDDELDDDGDEENYSDDMDDNENNYELDINQDEEDNESMLEDDEIQDDDMQSVVTENLDYKYDEKMDLNEEMKTLERIKEEKLNEQFPDEIDTPLNVAAKLRFSKYRGLASFHKSKWDPNENLPKEYRRITTFQNFKRSKKLAFQNQELVDGPESGEYVMVELKNFDKDIYFDYKNNNKLLLFFQLLRHEQKQSVINVLIKKHPLFTKPIKSKERLIFHVGCRRYSVCPLFSVHSNGNKHKYEKFLRSDTQMVASFYAPITFGPCSVSVYKQFENGKQHLVASGSLLSVDPKRIICKRLILSGYPFKIHKTFCVIRYMFFNRDDILWFKPIELRTKYGRKGTIKEPLGTHGHMKCSFDRPIKSNDTVLMNLYKRIFPKVNYEPNLTNLKPVNKNVDIDDNEMFEE